MYRLIFNQSKKLLPRISETELIALRSGGTSIDREIFSGNVDIDKIKRNNDHYYLTHQIFSLRNNLFD